MSGLELIRSVTELLQEVLQLRERVRLLEQANLELQESLESERKKRGGLEA